MASDDDGQAAWARIYAGLPPEKRRVADDISMRADDAGAQQRVWAGELVALVDFLLTGEPAAPTWLAVRMFWVRLHGVVTELIEQHRGMADIANGLTQSQVDGSLLKFVVEIFVAANAVLTALDEREVVVADYFRQRAAHLRQDSYKLRLRRGKDGGVLDTRRIGHIDEVFTIEEVDRMRAELLRQHRNELGFARHVAAKVAPHARRLLAAFQALYALPRYSSETSAP